MADAPNPELLDRYRLYEEIGAGGMAQVHLAKQVGAAGFSRVVAVKRLHPHLAKEPSFRAMIVDEGRLSARIDDARVVRTLDVVEGDFGVAVVMEYVLGESLANALEGCREDAPLGVIAAVVGDVLLGLHAAHEARGTDGSPLGIVHRDVSPQNVLIGKDGGAKLIDFGVAKARERLAATSVGDTKGKHGYMAPEQLAGRPVSRESDLYAVGVVLWEFLTRRSLFVTPEGPNVADRLSGVAAPPPSTWRAGVPPALDALVTRALSPRVQERPPTARAMLEALHEAVPPAPPAEVARWLERVAGGALEIAEERLARVERSEGAAGSSNAAAVASSPPPPPVPENPRAPAVSNRRRIALAIGGALLVGGLAFAVDRAARSAPVGGVEPSLVAPPEATVATGGERTANGPLPSSEGTEVSDDVAPRDVEPSLVAPSASSAPLRPRGAAGRSTTKPGARSRGPSCSPAYRFDAAGRKIYKPECL